MGDEDHLALPPFQELREPPYGNDVEIVRRFVEKEHHRPGDEDLCKVEAHLETAAQFPRVRGELVLGEAEPREHRLRLVRLVATIVAHGKVEARLGEDGPFAEGDVLGEMADGVAPGNMDLPRIGRLFPEYHPEKGRLTRPVAPNEPEALPRPDGKARPVEECLGPVGLGKVIDDKHGSARKALYINADRRKVQWREDAGLWVIGYWFRDKSLYSHHP